MTRMNTSTFNSAMSLPVTPSQSTKYMKLRYLIFWCNDLLSFALQCRMVELIPILLEFVRSRQKPGGYVVLVAHNGRGFDVPFLVHEFRRNDFEIPSNWYFLDTIPLSAQVMKSAGIFFFIILPSFGCNLDI